MVGRGLEIETKYDVYETAVVPALDDIPAVAGSETSVLRLQATYFDTGGLALGHRGITLRRRTGGVDDGWHLKLPTVGAREEIRAPLDGSEAVVPAALRELVAETVRDEALVPVATLTTERTVTVLRDVSGAVLAEICDDRVSGVRHGLDGDEAQSWREWELEEHGAPQEVVHAVDARLRAAGGRVAGHRSKVGRVLGVGRDQAPGRAPGRRATEHELLHAHLLEAVTDLHRLDPLVRADVPDSVHQMRVLTRRLRSTLKTFEKCFDVDATEPVRAELAWLGRLLGQPRDLEVLEARLAVVVSELPQDLVPLHVGPWIGERLRSEREVAHRAAVQAMTGPRYVSLVDTLDAWSIEPPWRENRDRPAIERLSRALDRTTTRLEEEVEHAAHAHGPDRASALHEVRKAAKRTRYAAEALVPVVGRPARRRARVAKQVQTVIGDQHDFVTAAQKVRRLAEGPDVGAEVAFVLGLVHAEVRRDAEALEADFTRQWKKVHKRL